MGMERGAGAAAASPYVTKRLCMTFVLFIGILCIIGGFLLGNVARNEIRRRNDIVSFNLTILAETVFKKAKRIPPKAVHHNDQDRVAARLRELFHCSPAECGTINGYNIAHFIKSSIKFHVANLMSSITNVSLYLDTLR